MTPHAANLASHKQTNTPNCQPIHRAFTMNFPQSMLNSFPITNARQRHRIIWSASHQHDCWPQGTDYCAWNTNKIWQRCLLIACVCVCSCLMCGAKRLNNDLNETDTRHTARTAHKSTRYIIIYAISDATCKSFLVSWHILAIHPFSWKLRAMIRNGTRITLQLRHTNHRQDECKLCVTSHFDTHPTSNISLRIFEGMNIDDGLRFDSQVSGGKVVHC